MDSTTAVIAYRIRRLSRAQLRALVEDLWSTRGQETVGRDDVSVDGRGLRAVHVRIDGSATRTETVVGDRRLAEMLQYAVEPAETRRLCETHLGAPPAELPPPPVTRGRRALGGLRGRASGLGRRLERSGSTAPPAAVLGAFLLLVGAVALAGLPADLQPDNGDAPAEGPAAPTDVNATESGAVGAFEGGGDRAVPMVFPADYPPSPALVDGDLQVDLGGSTDEGGPEGEGDCNPSRLRRVEGSIDDGLPRHHCQ